MKSLKNISILIYGLTLVLSLVSFSSGINQTHPKTFQTELVENHVVPNTRFSIQFQKINKAIAFADYKKFTFFTFKNNQDLKNNTLFKSYSNKTLCIETELLQTKLYTFLNTKILYEDAIV